jgi:hypothetical protein
VSGFVYRWYDKKHDRYYIGSHWGNENDGYISSSSWMKQAYRLRRNDFTREILVKISTSKTDLLLEEQKWLDIIKDDEFGKRYYNLKKYASGGVPLPIEELRQLSTKKWKDPEYRQKVADGVNHHWKDNEQAKEERSLQTKQRWANTEYQDQLSKSHQKNWKDESYRKKMSEANKKAWQQPERKEASKEFNSRAAHTRWSNPDYAARTKERLKALGAGHKGKHWYNDGTKSKMFHECPDGWKPGRIIPNGI